MKNYIILFCLLLTLQTQAQFANTSVLSQGNWYKIGITTSGIYKIDYNFLQTIGFSPESINPQKIQIYGNGGEMLPQQNDLPVGDDLVENAILVQGENDGSFDTQDYILFYAKNTDTWIYNNTAQIFEHQKNLYADTSYYFITVGENNGLRLENQSSIAGASQTIDSFEDYVYEELDAENIITSGRDWYGERFDFNTEQILDFNNIQGIKANTDITVTTQVMSRITNETFCNVSLNNTTLGQITVDPVGTGTYDFKGRNAEETFTLNSNTLSGNSDLQIKLNYDKNGGSGIAYLDFVRLQVERNLQLYGNQTIFRSAKSLEEASSEFRISNANNQLQIWDITDITKAKNQAYTLSGSTATFATNTGITLKEFVLFEGTDFPNPLAFHSISNQNLHALNTPNFVIISPKVFLSEANRLAEFRRTNDNLSVEVVMLEQIYNEFSSGKQDISAIRNFMKMLYERNPNTLKYLLLFGDASYDYKDRLNNNTNFIPIYESRESLHPIFSHSSDDYFGFLEDGEGYWGESVLGDHTLEIGIGRLPVKSFVEAKIVVDKLIHYQTNPETLGEWRNQIAFVADDGDANRHQLDADNLTNYVNTNYPNMVNNKLYLDAFEQEATANGEVSPNFDEAFSDAIDKGALILNFTGHGDENRWTAERILDQNTIQSWRNYERLPLFVTATCEFGRYEDPAKVSGAENILLSPRGGGIGLITTTRPVFASTNFLLNQAFYNTVFAEIDGEMLRLGDILRITKNSSLNGAINRNFSLLGDPSMRLAYPKYEVVVTQINGKSLAEPQDTMKALSVFHVVGEIQSAGNIKVSDFNGTLYVTILDKAQSIKTLGNEGGTMNYDDYNNLIFKGLVSVTNGSFNFSFPVPKDIDYRYDFSKWVFYAKNNEKTKDAKGSLNNILIGGTNELASLDNTPPNIELFMDNEEFISGGTTAKNTLLIAKLQDENGINTASIGIGHDLKATLNEDLDNPHILNEFYRADLDTYQSGRVEYLFQDLAKGRYTLEFTAWDTHNNSSEKSIDFVVIDSPLALSEVFNYPNPVRDFTNFSFKHNREGEDLEVILEVYNTQGRLVKSWQSEIINSDENLGFAWENITNDAQSIQNGVYVYKLSVKSLLDGSTTFVSKRLVVVN